MALATDGEVPAQALVVAGRPIGERVARYGPFVMNTEEQQVEAFDDYRSGRMARIPAEVARQEA